MKISFLNLCHCDSEIVARAANRLLQNENFDMYIHVDAKSDIEPFKAALKDIPRVYLIADRQRVYWGGFNAVTATVELLRAALKSERDYDYFVTLQNLDYPIRSNSDIERFFEQNNGFEFIRGCKIAGTHDWHFARKYRIYNKRDDEFYLQNNSRLRMYLHYAWLRLRSVTTLFFNGRVRENGETLALHYGAAQWAVTKSCAEYLVNFYEIHERFNAVMRRVQFPDEEYFHTAVHNSKFKYSCIKYDEPEERWLVNWRNLHYFEYPKEIVVFNENDYEHIISEDALFIRKVKSGISDKLLDMIDNLLDEKTLSPKSGIEMGNI